MKLLEAVYGRRAVRRYAATGLERADVEHLIDAAIQAPSAMNAQPWAFYAVLGSERLRGFSARAKAHLEAAGELPERARIMLRDIPNIFYGAPALVIVCATDEEAQSAQDCCLAAENFMLAAVAAGLSTCPIGFSRSWLTLPQTKSDLGIPRRAIPVFPIVVGVGAEEPANHGRRPPTIVWL